MTTTEPPAGMIVCDICRGGGIVEVPFDDGDDYCETCLTCNGSGFIPDPRIAIWSSNDPAAMLELCERDEERLQAWADACEQLFQLRLPNVRPDPVGTVEFWSSNTSWLSGEECTVKPSEAASMLRCIYPPPWLRRTCQKCNATGEMIASIGEGLSATMKTCSECKGVGTLPGVEIDPRWLSSTVCDLVRVATGVPCYCVMIGDELKECISCNGRHEPVPPDYSILPILADKLYEEGCDIEELTKHFWDGKHHVIGHCWVMQALVDVM